MAAHVSEQVSGHVAGSACCRTETFACPHIAAEKKPTAVGESNYGLKPCVGCGSLLGCTAECRGPPETEDKRKTRLAAEAADARVEAEYRALRRKWKWTPPAQNPYGSCECDELDGMYTCNSCLWDDRLRQGLLGKDRRCLDCLDCMVYGEECPRCDWT